MASEQRDRQLEVHEGLTRSERVRHLAPPLEGTGAQGLLHGGLCRTSGVGPWELPPLGENEVGGGHLVSSQGQCQPVEVALGRSCGVGRRYP